MQQLKALSDCVGNVSWPLGLPWRMCCCSTIINFSGIKMAAIPIPLDAQSLDAFGRYLCGQFGLLMDIYQDPSVSKISFQNQYLEPLCKNLECYVLNNLKFSASYTFGQNREVTVVSKDWFDLFSDKMLNQVIRSLEKVKSKHGCEVSISKSTTERLLVCEQVAAELGAALYHPLSTTLNLFKEFNYVASSKLPRNFASHFIKTVSPKMKNLTFLKLRWNLEETFIISIVLKDMNNLMAFTYRKNCQDYTISNLALYCKNVTSLDVKHSKEITDKSIPYILSFRNLNSLQIVGTGLSLKGVTEIVEGFSDNQNNFTADCPGTSAKFEDNVQRCHMIHLGIDLLLSNIQPILAFVNIKSLQLTLTKPIILAPLKLLCNLRALDIGLDVNSAEFSYFDFSPVMHFIATLGGLLHKLVLREVNLKWSDLDNVTRRCIFVQHIGLELKYPLEFLSWTCRTNISGNEDTAPDFLSCLICNFRRIPFWKLSGLIWRSDLFVSFVLLRIQRRELKTMTVNEYDMNFEGSLVSITSMFGARLTVEIIDFEQILKQMFHNAEHLNIRLRFKTMNEIIF